MFQTKSMSLQSRENAFLKFPSKTASQITESESPMPSIVSFHLDEKNLHVDDHTPFSHSHILPSALVL